MTGISDFTHSKQYTTMLATVTNDAADIRINNNIVTVADGKPIKARNFMGTAHEFVGDVSSVVGDSMIELTEYMAPTTAAISSMYDIGKQFDDIIKDNIAIQTMHIKGSDILCSAFCIIVSFLPCKTRNELYEGIMQAQRGLTALTEMAGAANEMVNTVNASFASTETVVDAASGLFSNNPIDTAFGEQPNTGMSAVAAIATIKAAVQSVDQIIQTFEIGLKILSGGKIVQQIDISGNVWDLAKSILYSFQSQAMQFADECIDKVIQPIEDAIIEWVPSECGTRGYAWRLFQKILDGISREKQWILQLIADLFASGTDFAFNMNKFTTGSMATLELKAFLDALRMISHRFGDLAIACGISPCSEDVLTDIGKNIAGQIKAGNITGVPVGVPGTLSVLPSGSTNLDDMAAQLASMLDLDPENVVATDKDLSFIYSVATNAPKKIKELIDLSGLGSDYSILNDGNDIKVVHTFKRMCGGE